MKEDYWKCRKCALHNKPTNKFCSECGTPLKLSPWRFVIAFSVLVFVVIFLYSEFGGFSSTTTNENDKFYQNVYSNVQFGMLPQEVLKIAGRQPDSVQKFQTGMSYMECWYYSALKLQICFEGISTPQQVNIHVISKNLY